MAITDLVLHSEPAEVEVLRSLAEHRSAIYAALESCAIDIGSELIAAKQCHPRNFMAWVEAELPFGIDRAERLMAVTRAFATCPEGVRDALPSAYSTMFELTRLPAERLHLAIEKGDVHPEMTCRQARDLARDWKCPDPPPEPEARMTADIIARELLRFPRATLSEHMARELRRWNG